MARLHLFELEDQKWFPSFLRNYGTDFLQFLANKTPMLDPAIPLLKEALEKSNQNIIVDVASGGGGGILRINEKLKEEVEDLKITLTDYYPNINAFKYTKKKADNISHIEKSIDARDVPSDIKGLRTMFLSLHHFKPNDAKQILQNAVDTKSGIAVFEGQERSIPSLIAMLFSPITLLLTTFFIKPFSVGRIIFTYLIPIMPLFVLWDGIVSSLRTYSVDEMKDLVNELENKDTFEWKIERIKSGPSVLLYLIGTPK